MWGFGGEAGSRMKKLGCRLMRVEVLSKENVKGESSIINRFRWGEHEIGGRSGANLRGGGLGGRTRKRALWKKGRRLLESIRKTFKVGKVLGKEGGVVDLLK